MGFSPLVMMLMQQEEEDQQKRRDEARRAAEALNALRSSWRERGSENPYERYQR